MAPLLARLCQQVGVNKGFWRHGRPPSFHDHGLNRHWSALIIEHGQGPLYFWGPVGCHKTHMLCARTLAAARRGFTARLVNWRAMCQEVTATWGKNDQAESSVVRSLVELDYLAIDDLAAGLADLSKGQQAVAANITYDVLNGRYECGVHTDLSANLPVEYMAEFFDERIHRRITELTTAYCMGQEDNDGKK
jgi:DNA replication protein DnaC